MPTEKTPQGERKMASRPEHAAPSQNQGFARPDWRVVLREYRLPFLVLTLVVSFVAVTVHGVRIVGPHCEPPGYERAESRVSGLQSPPATGGRTRSPSGSPGSARVRRRFPQAA